MLILMTLYISLVIKWTIVKEVQISGIMTDMKLSFRRHIKNICKKVGQKLSALLRISPYVADTQTKVIGKTMVKSKFNYCPLIWRFCSRKSNK